MDPREISVVQMRKGARIALCLLDQLAFLFWPHRVLNPDGIFPLLPFYLF